MEFNKFTSLNNSHQTKIINDIRELGYDKEPWVVTEKLDGANFAFYYNGTDFKVASRNQFVDGTFFNCQQVINLYKEKFINFYYEFIELNEIVLGDTLTLVGELIGDGILNRVKYRYPEGCNRDFRVFDIKVNNESLGFLTAYNHIDFIPLAPLIDICTFDEALLYDPMFKSYLSPEDVEVNYSEGVSLSPSIPKYLKSGSQVWLKNKSPEFKEKGVKTYKPPVELNEFDGQRLLDLLEFNNNSRVLSALSKFGEVTQKDFGKILQIVYEDILEDFINEYGVEPTSEVSDWKTLSKMLKKEISVEIRDEFIKLV